MWYTAIRPVTSRWMAAVLQLNETIFFGFSPPQKAGLRSGVLTWTRKVMISKMWSWSGDFVQHGKNWRGSHWDSDHNPATYGSFGQRWTTVMPSCQLNLQCSPWQINLGAFYHNYIWVHWVVILKQVENRFWFTKAKIVLSFQKFWNFKADKA